MLSVYFEELSSLHIEQIKSDNPISLLCECKVEISSGEMKMGIQIKIRKHLGTSVQNY